MFSREGNASIENSIPHSAILNQLLDQIQPINFFKLAEIGDGDNQIRAEHLLVITVEEILRVAKTNNWSLGKNLDQIYLYNGCFWDKVQPETMQLFLGAAAERLGVEKYRARYCVWAGQLYKQFVHSATFPTPENDNTKVLINFKNGTFEVSEDKQILRDFRSEDFLKYQLPFEYNPNATAPKFQQFLDEVLPDPEAQQLLAEYIGYVFIPSCVLKLEKVLLLYGTGANGKSVLFEIVTAMLGKDANVSNFSLKSLTNENGYFRAMLGDKLLNYSSDISDKMDDGYFKLLASGEPIEARLPYGRPMVLTNYAKLIFNLNELPMDVDQSNAYFRRLIIMPFDVTIPEEKQNKNLAKELIDSELSGVFNWALAGLHRLLKNGRLTTSKLAESKLQDYKIKADSVSLFLEESQYEADESNCVALSEIYRPYREYCTSFGYHPCSKRKFGERLKMKGIEQVRRSWGQCVKLSKRVF